MRWRWAALALASAALCAAPLLVARAQTPPPNPHGDLRIDCAACHTVEGWVPLRDPLAFQHRDTGFDLHGAHAQVSCRSCHQTLVFSRVGVECADCHRDPHRGQMGPQCDACHQPLTWSNQREMFRVHSRTRFPLLAAHASVPCDGCHGGQRPQEFARTPLECGACHGRDFEAARDPDHVRAGFSRRCEECHRVTSRSWEGGASFAHPASFPLRGAHVGVACESCHATAFRGAPRECVGCHQRDFDAAADPNHRASRFPTTCESCHSEQGWEPARFDHAVARFPLTGAHIAAPCEACHSAGFAGTPTQCVACHRDDQAAARNPDHRGFPSDCAGCHSTSGWRPAQFDHDRFFPIDSGPHRGTWSSCSTCHVNPANFGVFECTTCHDHRRDRMDDKHRRVAGYQYRSTACFSCHPRGTE